MAIDDNTVYGLTGAQVKELPEKINEIRGAAKVLTTADYNWPADNPTMVHLAQLEPGVYVREDTSVAIYPTSGTISSYEPGAPSITVNVTSSHLYIVDHYVYNGNLWGEVYFLNTSMLSSIGGIARYSQVLPSGSFDWRLISISGPMVQNSLTQTYTQLPLSAAQGKVLNDKIGGDLSNLTTTDKSSLINAVNEVAGKGGVIELTTDDYNANSSDWNDTDPANFDTVALWKLGPGMYTISDDNLFTVYVTKTNYIPAGDVRGSLFIIGKASFTYKPIINLNGDSNVGFIYRVNNNGSSNTGWRLTAPANSLTSSDESVALSANQGEVLNEKIGGDLSNLTTTDKSSLINAVNEVAGKGGVIELTTDDYNANSSNWSDTDPANFNCVALWKLEPGIYTSNSTDEDPVTIAVCNVAIYSQNSAGKKVYIVGKTGTYGKPIMVFNSFSGTEMGRIYQVSGYIGGLAVSISRPVNGLSSTDSTLSLSAAQGKVLNDKIGDNLSNLTTTDKSSLINAINELTSRVAALEGN